MKTRNCYIIELINDVLHNMLLIISDEAKIIW